jgi:hypothetical protein
MGTTRLQEAGCPHLLWRRGNGVARADRPWHGPPWHASPERFGARVVPGYRAPPPDSSDESSHTGTGMIRAWMQRR